MVSAPVAALTPAGVAASIRHYRLASSILKASDQPGRGSYGSEHELRDWLVMDGIQFTISDVGPSLAILESAGLIGRSPFRHKKPRPGWLAFIPEGKRVQPGQRRKKAQQVRMWESIAAEFGISPAQWERRLEARRQRNERRGWTS